MISKAYQKVSLKNKLIFGSLLMALITSVTLVYSLDVISIAVGFGILSLTHLILSHKQGVLATMVILMQGLLIAVLISNYYYYYSIFDNVDPSLYALTAFAILLAISMIYALLIFARPINKKWNKLFLGYLIIDSVGFTLESIFALSGVFYGLGYLLSGGVGVILAMLQNRGASLKATEEYSRSLRIGLYNATAALVLGRRGATIATSLEDDSRGMMCVGENAIYYISTFSPYDAVENKRGKLVAGTISLSDMLVTHVNNAIRFSKKERINREHLIPVILHSGNQYEMPAEGYLSIKVKDSKDANAELGSVVFATPEGLLNLDAKISTKVPTKVANRLKKLADVDSE